ncbi:MAG: GumC family protein [Pseudomonadota bacterium]
MKQEDDIEDGAGGGIPLGRILFALRKRMYVIALFAGLVTIGVAFLTTQLPNLYQATAMVQVEARERTIANLKDVVSDLKVNGATMESEVEILRSRAVALKVIDRLNLRNDPELFQQTGLTALLPSFDLSFLYPTSQEQTGTSWSADMPSNPGNSLMGTEPYDPRRDWVAAAFANRLSVQRVRTTLLIAISFRATDAGKAAQIANAVAEVYLEKQLEDKKRLTGYATETLEKKLDQMRTTVMTAERKVEEFKARNGIFATEGQILSEKQLARLMEQTVLARNETARARSKYEQALRVKKQGDSATTLADVLDNNTIRLMRVQLAETTRRRAELETKYGPRHPEILKIQAKVRDARRDLQEEVDRLVQGLKNVYTEAQTRETELQENLAARQSSEVAAKSQTVQLKELEREALSSKQLFEALLQRYKITAETQDLQLPDARIVETADIPLMPSSPNRKKLVAIAAIGALGIAVLFVLALEFATTGIGRPEDVETVLEVPYLASLPLLASQETRDPLRTIRMTISEPDHDFVEASKGRDAR